MKKLLTVLLALAMILCLGACGSKKADDAAAAPAADANTVKVGVTIYTFDDNFMTLYRNDIKAYFDALNAAGGTQYDVQIVDAANDMATQTEQVNTFISQGVDVMIINLVQTSTGAEISKLCDAAGIPVVFINREIPDFTYPANQCYVGADAKQSGTYQGEIIAALPDKGDVNGNGTVDYVMIMGDPENSDAQYRTEYSIKALTDAGIKVNKLVEQTGNWQQAQGQEIAAAALSQHGNGIDVIFCNNDGMALGAYEAIKAAGRTVGKDIYLVGVDALDECVQMVNEGTMTGTVLNDDVGQATAACTSAIALVAGEKPAETINYVPYVKITKDNVADYLK